MDSRTTQGPGRGGPPPGRGQSPQCELEQDKNHSRPPQEWTRGRRKGPGRGGPLPGRGQSPQCELEQDKNHSRPSRTRGQRLTAKARPTDPKASNDRAEATHSSPPDHRYNRKMQPLRLVIYDRTWAGRRWLQTGLTSSWIAGVGLYRALGRIDAAFGATSWEDALAWLASVEPTRRIDRIQFWGHGRWGKVFIARDCLDEGALSPHHSRHMDLVAIRNRMTDRDALWWFRSCETFGTEHGHSFAQAWSDFFGCRSAGHTYVIGPFQSGLHSLGPGARPTWSVDEGLAANRRQARMSGPGEPHTITCMHGEIPTGW